MSTATLPDAAATPAVAGAGAIPLARLTGEQYDRMVDLGVIGESDRIELIAGLLVKKMPKSRLHQLVLIAVARWLGRLPAGFHTEQGAPIKLVDGRPEPDVCVVLGQPEDYLEHPAADRIPLVVEVAGSSLAVDLGLKADAYAAAGIPVYLVVDLASRTLHLHSGPSATGYEQVVTAPEHAITVAGHSLGTLKTSDLFPADS